MAYLLMVTWMLGLCIPPSTARMIVNEAWEPPEPRPSDAIPDVEMETTYSLPFAHTASAVAEIKHSFDTPVVTVITPAHNPVPEHLLETAKSVLGQTLVAWQWLIIDDFTDDVASLAVLSEVVALDERISLISPWHRSADLARNQPDVGHARTLGASVAAGDYILFLDADDLIVPTALEKMFWFLETHPTAHFVNAYQVGFGAHTYFWERSINPSKQFATENVAQPTSMHRRNSLMNIGGFASREGGLEDWLTWLLYAANGMWGDTIRECLSFYRRRQSHSDRWTTFTDQGIADFRANISRNFPSMTWPGKPTAKISLYTLQPIRTINLGKWPRVSSQQKRVMLIVPWLEIGGADTFNLKLVRHFTEKGWHLTVVTTLASPCKLRSSFVQYTRDIILLNGIAPMTHFLEIVHNAIVLRGIDGIIISNSWAGYMMAPYLRERHPHIALLEYTHMIEHNWLDGGHARSSASISNTFDVMYVSSAHVKAWLRPHVDQPDKLKIAYASINQQWRYDESLRALARRALGFQSEEVILLYASRFADQKQPIVFAEAARKTAQLLKQSGSAVALRILAVGDGPFEGMLRRMLRTTNVTFIRASQPSDFQEILRASDVLISPSLNEGIPSVFFEAMAFGVVVVGQDTGGTRELVQHGVNGLLAPYDASLDHRISAVTRHDPLFSTLSMQYTSMLLRVISDHSWRMRLSRNAIERVKSFLIEPGLDSMMTDISSIANEHAARKPLITDTSNTLSLEFFRTALRSTHPHASLNVREHPWHIGHSV